MSLTGLNLQNFKCLADSGDIRLAPLTLIFGRNNSGKSSLIQSLLLLRQSLGAPLYGPCLNLAGPLYAAGSYTDIIHLHEPKRRLQIALTVALSDDRSANISLTFTSDEPRPPRLASLVVTSSDAPGLGIHRGKGKGGPFDLWIGEDNQGGEQAARFSFPVNSLFPLIGEEPPRRGRKGGPRARARSVAKEALETLERYLLQLRVVGAFRRPPERRYEFQGTMNPGADATGRDVIDALIESAIDRRAKINSQLFAAVNTWLEKLANVQVAPLSPDSKDGGKLFSINIRDLETGRLANYADVGFGIGQALPVLVEGLRTQPGGLFVVMEPEIHLHPDAQLAMADFLIELARSGRQVIVETHSEHLLLRIRRRIVSTTKQRLPKELVSVLYVARQGDSADKAQHLDLDDLGQVANWPSGFFSEANNERMALLAEMAARIEGED